MMASKSWQQPFRQHRCLGKRQQELDSHLDSHLYHHRLLDHQQHRDSDVWNARICLELCGCTAQYSSDTSSGAHGTIGIVDIYAPSSNYEQPPRPLVLMVADESGAPRRAAVSPTRHLPGSKLSGTYLNEFGLGCIHHAGGFHRRLPDGFLPK